MDNSGFYLFVEYKDKFKRLSDAQLGCLIRALFDYKETGTVPEIEDTAVGVAFDIVKPDIDKQAETYRKRQEAGAKGGSKGKRGKANESKAKQTEANESKAKQTEANESKAKQTEANETNKKEKETEKENITPDGVKEEAPKGAQKKSSRFSPPTLADVQEYCRGRDSPVDPEKFFSYYESNGWKVGRNPMKDWKAAVRSWERNDYSKTEVKQEDGPADYPDPYEKYRDRLRSVELTGPFK